MPKPSIEAIEGDRIRLRLLTREDLITTLSWRNQDEIRKWFFHSDLIDFSQHLKWFESYAEKDDDLIFIIEDKDCANKPVGQVAIYHIDWKRLCCEFGRLMIGEPSVRGKGLAKESTFLVSQLAIEQLGLREIYLEVYADNERAVELYRKCGFRKISQTGSILYFVKTA